MSAIGAIYSMQRAAAEPDLDSVLISRCRKKDADAFGVLVDRYQSRIFGFVRRMVKDQEDAEDIAQEVFIRAFTHFHRYDGRASLTTWLFKIATNLCIDRARKKERRPEQVVLDRNDEELYSHQSRDERWDPESHAVAHELHQILDSAIESLSEKLKTVLLLHDMEGLSYEQIAHITRIPIGTVKSRLFLARNHLQNSVSSYLKGGIDDEA